MTLDNLLFAAKFLSLVGCGVMAGFFFAFSVVVMSALSRLPPPAGIGAMQHINIVVINRLFFTFFFGTGAACLVSIVFSLLRWQQPDSPYLLGGSLLYLVGTILVTIIFNVPLNEALAKVEPDSVSGANLWANYLVNWTLWNHVRTIAAFLAAISFTAAFYFRTGQ